MKRDLENAFVYENRDFLPRAFLVHRAVVADTDSSAIAIMKQPDFDPAGMIVLHDGEPMPGDTTVTGERVEIVRNDGDRVVINASVRSPGYLFYSGNYLPHWRAQVDGEDAAVVRCNVAFRAVYVEPGEHVIEMKYASPYLRMGFYICVISCGLIGLAVYAGVRRTQGETKHA
jgi:hypothetical protein